MDRKLKNYLYHSVSRLEKRFVELFNELKIIKTILDRNAKTEDKKEDAK